MRQKLSTVLDECSFPLSRGDLLGALSPDDFDLLQAIEALDDDTFVSRVEVEQRVTEALGMPDAVIAHSALDTDPDWVPPAG